MFRVPYTRGPDSAVSRAYLAVEAGRPLPMERPLIDFNSLNPPGWARPGGTDRMAVAGCPAGNPGRNPGGRNGPRSGPAEVLSRCWQPVARIPPCFQREPASSPHRVGPRESSSSTLDGRSLGVPAGLRRNYGLPPDSGTPAARTPTGPCPPPAAPPSSAANSRARLRSLPAADRIEPIVELLNRVRLHPSGRTTRAETPQIPSCARRRRASPGGRAARRRSGRCTFRIWHGRRASAAG